MLNHARALAQEYAMLPRGGTVLCAVSGGADSMCLLHWLLQGAEAGGYAVAAAHYNHRLRGAESDRDAAFVRDWCTARGVPCLLGGGDVAGEAACSGQGVEEAGRRLRYAFLRQAAEEAGAQVIATAHTADDNGETLLLHLIRGSGLQGLTGIPPRRGVLIRPLLTTSRQEVEAYNAEHGVAWVEDATNADPAYARNFVRLQVMPLLRELNPSLTAALSSAAASLRQDNDFLNAQAARTVSAARWAEDDLVLRADLLASLPPALGARVVQGVVERMAPDTVLSRAHRQAVLDLARGQDPSARTDLPGGLAVQRVYGELLFTDHEEPLAPLEETPLAMPGETAAGSARIRCVLEELPAGEANLPDSFYLSCAKVEGGLTLRSRRAGDRLALPGRAGGKSLKKWLIDEKVPRRLRDRVPVLAAGEAVAAVAGLGPDAAFAARPGEAAWHITVTLA